ncbi:MAG TPA: dihydroneopterin aldolase [Casimicrobiaceae bacterium]|nr:dihydroneopterin aldolase [Casimicrobiaceae bacterium]
MNTIFISDLRVETRIGVYEWEEHLPQTLRLDLEIELPSDRPFTTGAFEDALDYAAVVARIKEIARSHPHRLLEAFTGAVADMVLGEFNAPAVRVRVAKLGALPGVKEIGVSIERRR